MDHPEPKASSRHKHSRDKTGSEHKSKRKHKSDKDGSRKRHRKAEDEHMHIVDDDANDDDMWVEKNIDMDGERPLATTIPTAESLGLTTQAMQRPSDPALPPSTKTETTLQRDEWMLMPPSVPTVPDVSSRARVQAPTGDESLTDDYGGPSQNARTTGGTVDFFTSLGTDIRKRKPEPDRPDPDKPKISHRELNIALKEGKSIDDQPAPTPKAVVPGGPGSQWRMMKLRRVYETAEEEGKAVEEVAVERFGSLEAFAEACEERRVLDERSGRRASRGGERRSNFKGKEPQGERGFMFTDAGGSGASSRSASFRRPGVGDSAPSTPTPTPAAQGKRRFDSLRLPSQAGTPLSQAHTPVPSVMTPSSSLAGSRALSASELNKMQAKVLRAKLMGGADAEALEKEYEEALRRSHGEGAEEGVRTRVEVLPTLDAHGRLYDVGQGKDDGQVLPGNRKKKEIVETRDPKTGDLVRYNADDDTITLGEMLRQERFGAGMADQKNLDAEFARAIMSDGKFQNDIDYIDDNAEKLGRKKMRSDAMKRQFAINDYKRTQQVLSTCTFCYGEDDSPPKAPVIAMGTRVYLSCTQNEELVEGHCLIVPIQHHLATLEGDDDVWDEVRNFMKCLMRMFAEEDKGVVFYETVLSLKRQNHTFIECVPLPWAQFEDLPGYFKESILMSETEWSQHKKLIDFSARPGGFRRAMVPNLPYFMVQFDYKGEKGFGHVIEGTGESAGNGEDPEGDIDEGEKGGGDFPRYFAAEIVGNLLDMEPRRWRHPRRVDFRQNKERVAKFRQKYDKFDWTGMIGRS
ncbi:CwfJ C-terminus 1-domain-containing protein-like protein [Amylocystis lapponica]|nr:CwfJ C-terminus 1-domain-containing protein-like protein [Amylocystis lapponica]